MHNTALNYNQPTSEKWGQNLFEIVFMRYYTVAAQFRNLYLTTMRSFSKKVLVDKLEFSCNKEVPSAALKPSVTLNLDWLISIQLWYLI